MSPRIIIIGAGAAIGGLLYALGYVNGASAELDRVQVLENEQLRSAFEQGQALGVVRDRVVTEYVDRVNVIEKAGRTIIKEVPIYVSEAADRACPVSAGFVRVHDAAAAGLPSPGRPGPADEAPSRVALSAIASTVAGNYTECHANAEQLGKLQKLLLEYQVRAGQAASP